MHLISSRLKKFDVHVKTVDVANEQTIVGAVITLLCVAVTVLLIISEITLYMSKDVVHHLVVDQGGMGHDTVRLDFEFEFPKLACKDLSFSQEVVRGTVHAHDDANITFTPIAAASSPGCRLQGYIITDKVGGNFRVKVQSDALGDSGRAQFLFAPPEPARDKSRDPEMSHVINRLSFVPVKETLAHSTFHTEPIFKMAHKSPLSDTVTAVDKGIGLHHYGLNIVPTHKKTSRGKYLSRLDRYSVTERQVKIEDLNRGISIGGGLVQNFIGVIVTYDFYPVMIVMEEEREGVLQFVTSLCAIIGGVITVMSLINRCLYSSVKVLLGKKD